MSNISISTSHLPSYLLVILYILTGTLSNFGAIDILAPQWIYLGSINLLACFYILYNAYQFQLPFSKLYTTIYLYIYLFYIIWNALSYFYAINPVETLINLPRVFNTFSAIYFSFLLVYQLPNKFYFLSRLFLVFITLELFAFYNDFITLYGSNSYSVLKLKGFAGNKNITAASIAFKIPFLLYLLNTSKKSYFILLNFVLLTFAALAVSIIEARAAILSSIVVLFFFIIFQLVQVFSKKTRSFKGLPMVFLTIAPYLFAFGINNLISKSTRQSDLSETVSKIQFTEESSNGRFDYWTDAYHYILDNPIIASGLGNWKIASISRGKEHISGYTVPYHAHNDFIHVFAETGLLGGFAYILLFLFLSLYLFQLLYHKYQSKGVLEIQYFFLLLPLVVYGIDAGLNFPVARPLMQSSFAIYASLILSLYLSNSPQEKEQKQISIPWIKGVKVLFLLLLIPSLYIHILSYISLTKQGLLLYEFNNASFKMTRSQLDEISHDFPNLTETAMPIKAMKARYYYLQGNKEEAYEMIDGGIKDNPEIFFGENLKALYFLNENKVDSAYVYAKKAFDGLPNNMPHFDVYMRTLVLRKAYQEIDEAFNRVHAIAGDSKTLWLIYVRSLAQTRSLGDPFAMQKAADAYALYPDDETIFTLYRVLTYGQQRIVEGEQFYKQATALYQEKNYAQSAILFGQALDKDPLRHTYALNAGLSYYESAQFDEALRYFNLALASKNDVVLERSLRYKALSLYFRGEQPQACAVFLKLRNTYPKRMYQQEFEKYCLGKK